MSLVFTSFTGGTLQAAGTTQTAAAGSNVQTAGATDGMSNTPAFAQSLMQSMGGGGDKGKASAPAADLASLLQGLLATVQTSEDETASPETANADQLLEELTQDMDKLDENILNDPALLTILQGWLQQTAVLLNGTDNASQSAGGGESADTAQLLSPLAQQPETMRFAVQDELSRLTAMIQEASAAGNEGDAGKGVALLGQFSSILAESSQGNKVKGAQTAATAESALKNSVDTKTILAAAKEQSAVSVNASSDAVSVLKQQTAAPVQTLPITGKAGGTAKTAETPLTQSLFSEAVKESAATEEPGADSRTGSEHASVLTAGQLSLKDGVTAPHKAVTQQVPVHQFADEMNTFIKGNLAIVQKGDVAEATITLFPEHLGQVDVKITMQNGHVVAQFMTEHAGAKDMLEQQMSQLRAALQSNGLQVEKLEVAQGSSSLLAQYNGQEGRQSTSSGGQQQNRRSKERLEDNGDAVLAAELSGELKEWVQNAQQEQLLGGSFSAKA